MIENTFYKIVPAIIVQKSHDEVVLVVKKSNLLFALLCLKKHIGFQYNLLTCVSGVDLIGLEYRFSVVYELLSLVYNTRIRVKVFLTEVSSLESATSVFINANWWEREVWDLFGIFFDKHPDLRRILTDYGFEGYPLRKDFPLSGFYELAYSDLKQSIEENRVELAQGYREFNTLN